MCETHSRNSLGPWLVIVFGGLNNHGMYLVMCAVLDVRAVQSSLCYLLFAPVLAEVCNLQRQELEGKRVKIDR